MNSRIIIIVLSVIIAILVTVNILMFRVHREAPFMPGPGPEYMDGGTGMRSMHRMTGNRFGRNFCTPDFMKEKLNLSSEQIARIEELNSKFDNETTALFARINPEREKLRNILRDNDRPDMNEVKRTLEKISSLNVKLQLLRIEQGCDIDRILTAEQQNTLRRERDMFFERMQKRRGGRDE